MYIYAINGFMRMPWIKLANASNSAIFTYLYFFVHLILVLLFAVLVQKIEQYFMPKIKEKLG
jgi:hypothetical protein